MNRSIYCAFLILSCLGLNLSFAFATAKKNEPTTTLERDSKSQYTFAWSFHEDSDMKPRGGTTTGEQITLDKSTSSQWRSIQKTGLSKFERDRLAILAMSGGYRASFDFLETLGFTENHAPARPYQSWGTEYVYVVEDKKNFISLQHVLVMYFESNNDQSLEPMVMKHWRQDWHYEDTKIHIYQGFNTWKEKVLKDQEVTGKWSQAVYQVDDSPRYQAIGSWQHTGNYSSWLSEETWRPLPRREFSVRSDYDVLIGTNKHTITPTGWVQEEDNLKIKLQNPGILFETSPVIAKEIGLARYEKITNHDWTPGDKYWGKTAVFWASVRGIWSEILEDRQQLTLDQKKLKERSLFMAMFGMANKFSDSKSKDQMASEIEITLLNYLATDKN